MAARPQRVGQQCSVYGLATILVFLLLSASHAQTFYYYDANGHSQGRVICDEMACEVFASSTSLGRVLTSGVAYDNDGDRLGSTDEYGQNWRPGNFWVRPELPSDAESSADPEGWSVPLAEALRSDAIGGEMDRVQLRALQAAAFAFGEQNNFVSAANTDLGRRIAAPHDLGNLSTTPAVVIRDAAQVDYVMLRGIWVLAVGKASNLNQATVWWPGSDGIETAVVPLSEVTHMLNSAGIVLGDDNTNRVQYLATHRSATAAAKASTICVSGDPRLRRMVEDAMKSWHDVRLDCSDAGNDFVLTVVPTGRWISVLQVEDPHPLHFHYPQTAFEAVGVLRDRAGQELWWVKKESWNGRGDRAQVAKHIAKAFRKFYSAYIPVQHASENSRSGSGELF